MQRRLEDVSHFFFDHRDPAPSVPPFSATSQGREPRSRVIHVSGCGDHVTAGMIVAGLAASANRMGRRVLAAQTHDQPFGVAFGLGAESAGKKPVIVQADPDLWVATTSLLGAKRPGVFFDQPATALWLARASRVDLVLVHVNHHDGITPAPAMPIPDEFIVVAADCDGDALIDLYRAIKRAVSWNPCVKLGVLVAGAHDERTRSWDRLIQAVSTFLGRPCSLVGSITNLSALSHAFLSGRLLRGGTNEVTREFAPIAGRWAGSDAGIGRSIPAGARPEPGAAYGDVRGGARRPDSPRRWQ